MIFPEPPLGFRLMKKGDHPKKGDLSFSILRASGWSGTTMTGDYTIPDSPAVWPRQGLVDPKITMEYALIWATKE